MSATDADADHDVLVGALALQFEFVTQDQLARAAANDGAARRTLIERLQAHGVLTPDEGELLTALVARHLARNDNDPARSLANLSTAPDAVQYFTRIEDRAPFRHQNAPVVIA